MTTLADAIATPSGISINGAVGELADAASKSVVLSTGSKALLTNLATLLTAIGNNTDGLEGFTDGLEALLGTANTSLATIATNAASSADSPVEAHQPCDVVVHTPAIDTGGVYLANDVLFPTVAITMARANDLRAMLTSLTVIDKKKSHPGITLFFFQTNVTSAAANAVNSLSAADAINCLGFVSIATTAWKDLTNASFACLSGQTAPNLLLEAAAGSQNVYVVGIVDNIGTGPTYSAGDIAIKYGFVQQ